MNLLMLNSDRVNLPPQKKNSPLQIDSLGKDDRPSAELRVSVGPYLLEAGLDIDRLISDPGLISQGLILFNVLLKRKLELDDIVKGRTSEKFLIRYW